MTENISPAIEEKLGKLSLKQKIDLLSGADVWRTVALSEIGIPQIKVTDGPNGARGDLAESVPAACFPTGVALGATWSRDIMAKIGSALAEETRSKASHVLLGPTINLQRTPVGGRNFECYSEDPHLTAELAIPYVRALQASGIGACPKHFVGNDTEYERLTISSNIDERTLREVYLAPFERLVNEAQPWSIMAAYNGVNGTTMCSHKALLVDTLKDEWGFDGLVISDWFAGRDTVENANGGLDLEMPGPSRIWGKALETAVEKGEVSAAVIDDKVIRLLRLIERAGISDNETVGDEIGIDNADHRALIRRAGAEAMVLLKNDNKTLPLNPKSVRSVAVIGPNAELGQIMGGGSSFVNSHTPAYPLEGLQAAFAGANIRHEQGCHNYKYLPMFRRGTYSSPSGTADHFLMEVFENAEFEGVPAKQSEISTSRFIDLAGMTGNRPNGDATVRIRGEYQAEHSGEQMLGIFSAGPSRILIDGEIVVDNWTDWANGSSFFGFGSDETRTGFEFDKGRRYQIAVEYLRPQASFIGGLQFGIVPPPQPDAIERAVQAAKESDQAILILGSNADWETEGHDRASIALPGDQDALAEAVLAANPDTIIVMNVGSVTQMPWYDKARTVLICWFLGQEMGNALGDVLTGLSEPSGRLPFTWPRRIEDHPCFDTYPGAEGQMPYDEGLLIGHRWYDKHKIQPLAAFGAGLGYGDISVEAVSRRTKSVDVTIRNAADHASLATVQVYAQRNPASGHEPVRTLVGFTKAHVSASDQVDVTVDVQPKHLREWDTESGKWHVLSGVTLCIGLSSAGPFVEI